ncbi:MAG TPA: nucleotidyltransferase domain-containing protein [Candidatus Dormibacteraeota bacterium]|nr:nucleotidyltransferase domain-containing protein [Candidatus Dormibacteraeota bacterium]
MAQEALTSSPVFTVEQRDALRDRVLRLAKQDERVVAGALVGSLAVDGGGDRYSDLDLTFGIDGRAAVAAVLDDWTRTLGDEIDAVRLVDLERDPITYRVFLLADALQFDLSMSPAAEFRPAGPRFRLLFGETAPAEPKAGKPPAAGGLFIPTPTNATDLFGWGVIYALHARACIERGRVWQAEHYVGAVRDHALSLACLREGRTAAQARGYDELSPETLARFAGAHVGAVQAEPLRAALAAAVGALLREGAEARLPHAGSVAERLAELR